MLSKIQAGIFLELCVSCCENKSHLRKFHTYCCFPRSLGWDLFRLIQVLPGIFMYVLGLAVLLFISQIYHVCLQIGHMDLHFVCLQRKKKKKRFLCIFFCPVSSPHVWQFSHFCHKCKCLQVIEDLMYFSLFFWTSLNVLFSACRKVQIQQVDSHVKLNMVSMSYPKMLAVLIRCVLSHMNTI